MINRNSRTLEDGYLAMGGVIPSAQPQSPIPVNEDLSESLDLLEKWVNQSIQQTCIPLLLSRSKELLNSDPESMQTEHHINILRRIRSLTDNLLGNPNQQSNPSSTLAVPSAQPQILAPVSPPPPQMQQIPTRPNSPSNQSVYMGRTLNINQNNLNVQYDANSQPDSSLNGQFNTHPKLQFNQNPNCQHDHNPNIQFVQDPHLLLNQNLKYPSPLYNQNAPVIDLLTNSKRKRSSSPDTITTSPNVSPIRQDVFSVPTPVSSPPGADGSLSYLASVCSATFPSRSESQENSIKSSVNEFSKAFTFEYQKLVGSMTAGKPQNSSNAQTQGDSNSVYSSALHQLVLLQHWVPILEKMSPANKSMIWETCNLVPGFKPLNKNSFKKTVNMWATNILPNMQSITILFGAIGFLKHHDILKNEFYYPNTSVPVFRTFISHSLPKPKKSTDGRSSNKVPINVETESPNKKPRKMDVASILNA
eukprot:TRINITY_DN8848_c0_g1_i1.p1 TRINITY_DN8848_c0_g1~~TRINITY_DN8848_c0_g1_i1.p1  ORF type:complete len:476 (-),score=94.24 TRINITY_DN8848_c0_g1_i1:34-1461(-)